MPEQDRRKARFAQDATDDQILDAATALVNLTLSPGWGAWEAMVRSAREEGLEQLASTGSTDIQFWQGYVAALAGVLNGPSHMAVRAKEIQDAQQEADGTIVDQVRVGFGVGESSI